MTTASSPSEALRKVGIKPSAQRIAIIDYLTTHRTHPSADEIYTALSTRIPSLSRATVYNTLRSLVEHGAALELKIDDQRSVFDGCTEPHAHFFCRKCRHVFDFELKNPDLAAAAEVAPRFKVLSSQLYFQGVCADCLDQEQI